VTVFDDPFALEDTDDREDYSEKRTNPIGQVGGVILDLTYTQRGHRIRIISARRAEPQDQDYHYREN
jgi:uncharacterized DUF497 family protein